MFVSFHRVFLVEIYYYLELDVYLYQLLSDDLGQIHDFMTVFHIPLIISVQVFFLLVKHIHKWIVYYYIVTPWPLFFHVLLLIFRKQCKILMGYQFFFVLSIHLMNMHWLCSFLFDNWVFFLIPPFELCIYFLSLVNGLTLAVTYGLFIHCQKQWNVKHFLVTN